MFVGSGAFLATLSAEQAGAALGLAALALAGSFVSFSDLIRQRSAQA